MATRLPIAPRSLLDAPQLGHYASRVLPFESSISLRLAQLNRLSGGPPDVVVCILGGMPVTQDEELSAGSRQAAMRAATLSLVQQAIGVDVFVLASYDVDTSPSVRA